MMELTDKVALLTGGARGLGFAYGKELLRNGLKHLVIADLATSVGEESASRLNTEFGEGRVIFIPCDVTNEKQFDDAFARTIEKYGGVDIVVNNAGILNEPRYDLMIDVNFTSVVRGSLLGLRHMGKDKGGKGGVIVNASSLFGLDPIPHAPIYSGTKMAIIGFSRGIAMPYHYDKTGVRVLTICPGVTETELLTGVSPKNFLDSVNLEDVFTALQDYRFQKAESVAEGVVHIIRSAKNGTVWIAEGGEPIREISFPDRFEMTVKDRE